ncbi:inhibitor of the pro-sigma K processing machinery [Methanomicrobium sp. W14]|uniref:pro-sigmaK processing inhibitor BofA family protein n=1 Tax=Methanomicrobium sp. W14 TaxID=2817839 RepID=UPI001AE29ABA|nr:pro-sigmaK processing inhibitor BofA family protein [Methanomicrobium sp. W14]MBP2133602.1 inhibitor of the pro-sigma K processing machinery [Methanomicrobium sp. W14]
MLDTLITIIIAGGIVFVLWYFLKNLTTLIINSVVGLVTLIIVSQMNLLGMESFNITWGAVLVCALGGLPGAILLMVLNLAGITI